MITLVERKKCAYTWGDVDDFVTELIMQIEEGLPPEIIIGVLRGGAYPAMRLAKEFEIPIDYIGVKRYNQQVGKEPSCYYYPQINMHNKSVLVIDDIYDKGDTYAYVKEIMEESRMNVPCSINYGFLTTKRTKPEHVIGHSIPVHELHSWMVFPWEGGDFG
tara:strand:+ start:1072 stop:1554 length:483 start_codon:yes stop_codon:yes gene_type:complete